MAEKNPPQKKTPTDYISDSELLMRNWTNAYAHLKKRDFMTLLRDQLKSLKQHYHTLQLSVIPQLKEDLTENQR